MKGDIGIPGNTGPAGPTGPPGQKGAKGEPGQSISAPSLLQPPTETTINESQTAILKCSANGNPLPKVEWSKLKSSLPAERHVIEPSGALIVRDVRPGDQGVYSCRAENLLGSANASAKLTVQCKFYFVIFVSSLSFQAQIHFKSSIKSIVYLNLLKHNYWKKNTFLEYDIDEMFQSLLCLAAQVCLLRMHS